jgi:hypothetical protein
MTANAALAATAPQCTTLPLCHAPDSTLTRAVGGKQMFGDARSRLLDFCWRMFSHRIQNSPQVDYRFSIHLQRLDCCSPYWRQSYNEREIIAPRKMVAPTLLSRMIQRNNLLRHRIARVCLGVLVIVAPLTTPREVVKRGLTTHITRNDVVNRKRLHPKTGLTAAIFTTAACACGYNSSLLGSDAFMRHNQAREFPNLASAL